MSTPYLSPSDDDFPYDAFPSDLSSTCSSPLCSLTPSPEPEPEPRPAKKTRGTASKAKQSKQKKGKGKKGRGKGTKAKKTEEALKAKALKAKEDKTLGRAITKAYKVRPSFARKPLGDEEFVVPDPGDGFVWTTDHGPAKLYNSTRPLPNGDQIWGHNKVDRENLTWNDKKIPANIPMRDLVAYIYAFLRTPGDGLCRLNGCNQPYHSKKERSSFNLFKHHLDSEMHFGLVLQCLRCGYAARRDHWTGKNRGHTENCRTGLRSPNFKRWNKLSPEVKAKFWNANVDRYEARRAQGDIFVHEWETDLPEGLIPEVDKEEDSDADVKVEDEE